MTSSPHAADGSVDPQLAALTRRQRSQRTERAFRAAAGSASEARRRDLLDYVVRINDCLARDVASRYDGDGIDGERVLEAARLGLSRAAHEFDPTGGEDWLCYAVSRIRHETEELVRTWAIPDATGWTSGT